LGGFIFAVKDCYNIVRMWFFRRKRKKTSTNKTYLKHKEEARLVIHSRLTHFAPLCGVNYKRVAIRDTKRSWGSCSSLGNLNFNYKLIFLPKCLSDYVIVHELCHLKELNHSQRFWDEVEKVMPEYRKYQNQLRVIERTLGTTPRILNACKISHNCAYCNMHNTTPSPHQEGLTDK